MDEDFGINGQALRTLNAEYIMGGPKRMAIKSGHPKWIPEVDNETYH